MQSLFYDTPAVLFSRLSETKALASTTHKLPFLFITPIDLFFRSVGRKTTETLLSTNKPLGRLNHDSVCSGTGLRRDEQDGSWSQHEFASLVCLDSGSVEKTPQSHWAPCTEWFTSVIRQCGRGWLTRLSVASNGRSHSLVFRTHV